MTSYPSAGEDQLEVLRRQAMGRRLLSAAEEVRLAKQIERGDLSAKHRMVESNLRLVFSLARSHPGRGVAFADLVQEGTIGLLRAVELFDHRRGVKFSTYAVWWIRRSLRDAVAASRVIRIPPRANGQIGVARVTASLDEPVGEDGTLRVDLVADESATDPSEHAIAHEESRTVWDMLRLLPERHRAVVLRRYGLDEEPAQSYEEIGARLGLGKERSRQLEREPLHRLRTVATALAA